MKNVKNINRRTLTMFLALAMCLGMLNLTAFAAEGDTTEPVEVLVDKGTDVNGIKEALDTALGKSSSGTWYYWVEPSKQQKNCEGAWIEVGDLSHTIVIRVMKVQCAHTQNTPVAYAMKEGTYSIVVSPNADGTDAATVKYIVKQMVKPTITVDGPSVIMLEHKFVDGQDAGQNWEQIRDQILDHVTVENGDLETMKETGTVTITCGEKELGEGIELTPGGHSVTVSWTSRENPLINAAGTCTIKFVDRNQSFIEVASAPEGGYTVENAEDIFAVLNPTVTTANGVPEGETAPELTAYNITDIPERLTHGAEFDVTITFVGNERWASAEKTVTLKYTGKQAAPVMAANCDIRVENVYKLADGKPVVDVAATWAKVEAAIREEGRITSMSDDFTVNMAEIAMPECPATLTDNDVTVNYVPSAEAYSLAQLTFRVAYVDGRADSKITVKDAGVPVVYDGRYDVLKQAVLAKIVDKTETNIPEGAELKIEYQTIVSLEKLNLDLDSVRNVLKQAGADINLEEKLGDSLSVWAPFEGGPCALTAENLGWDNLPDEVQKEIDAILGKVDTSRLYYPPITAGEQTVRVSYAGNEEYTSSFAAAVVVIEKVPAKVLVSSKVIYEDEAIVSICSASRTDDNRDVTAEAYVVWAGLSADAALELYLDLPEPAGKSLMYPAAKETLKAAGFDLDETIALGELYSKLGNWEKVVDLLKELGVSADVLDQISNALNGVTGGDSQIAESLQTAIEALQNSFNGVADSGALENITITINGVPKSKAGVYGVAAFLGDTNYKPESNGKIMSAGYLVIKLRGLLPENPPALGHKEVIDDGYPATCTEPGMTEGKHCEVCGEVLIAQKVIPAQNHKDKKYVINQNGTHTGICNDCGETVDSGAHMDADSNNSCDVCGAIINSGSTGNPGTGGGSASSGSTSSGGNAGGGTVIIDNEDIPLAELPVSFTDVKTEDWYYDAVKYVYEAGLMKGVSDDFFGPKINTNRAMIVTILYRLEGEPEAEAASFLDVKPDAWYTDAVGWGEANGIVNGYGGAEFGPEDLITREQTAAILHRYAQYKGYDVSASGNLTAFVDSGSVSNWAAADVAWSVGAEMISGKGAGVLDPAGLAIRAEIAQILMNFCEKFVPAAD